MNKYGLIGKSLGHSFSKEFFTKYFESNSIDASYSNIELSSIEEFEQVKDSFSGFNVTIPYKESIISYLDEVTDEAQQIGAVNTVLFREGKCLGFNTDAVGFHQSIKPFLTNRHERALILGTGGASKAVVHVLEKLGINVLFVSRSPEGDDQFSYDDVNANMLSACKLIVNCTPVGTFPEIDASPLNDLIGVGKEHLVVDLIYNPSKTKFLSLAQEKGATILNGESMLRIQALKSYEIWTSDV